MTDARLNEKFDDEQNRKSRRKTTMRRIGLKNIENHLLLNADALKNVRSVRLQNLQ